MGDGETQSILDDVYSMHDDVDEGDAPLPDLKADPVESETKPDGPDTSTTEPKSEVEDTGETETQLDTAFVDAATKAGFATHQIELLGKHGLLEKVVGMLPTPALPATKPESTQETTEATGKEDGWIPVDTKEFSDEFVAVTNQMRNTISQLRSEVAELHGLRAEISQASEAQQQEAFARQFDDAIAKLDGWHETFGKGARRELKEDSLEFQNRVKLIEEMKAFAAGYQQIGKPLPSFDVIVQKALASAFDKERVHQAVAQHVKKVKQRQTQFTGRPAKRGDNTLKGEERALARIGDFFDEHRGDLGLDE